MRVFRFTAYYQCIVVLTFHPAPAKSGAFSSVKLCPLPDDREAVLTAEDYPETNESFTVKGPIATLWQLMILLATSVFYSLAPQHPDK